MKAKTVRMLRGTAMGVVAFAVSFFLLRPAGELCAVLIRRQWPSFSGLIVWYADFLAVGFSIAIAAVVGRVTFKRCGS